MAVNGDLERMTSSDLDNTSQTETEDTDTGDLEESGTTFSSSDSSETSFCSISSSSKISKDSDNADMKSVSSADGSTSTGNVEPSDSDRSDTIFKYPAIPKLSYDFTEVSELSNFENLSNYDRKFSVTSQREGKKAETRGERMFQFPDFMSLKGDWYSHPCFKSYWDHYSSVMSWCSRHYQVQRSLINTDRNKTSQRQYQDNHQISNMFAWQQYYLNSYYSSLSEADDNRKNFRGKSESSRRRRSRKKKKKSRSSKSENKDDGEQEDLDETFEMEITEDMMEFFKQSEEHRRLREEEKRVEQETADQEGGHVNIEEVKVTAQKGPTTAAPKERPGAKRTSEMKLLYGKGAPMIHGMETALQMTFDRNLDIKEPKVWPNMPLKLVFG